MTPREKYSAMVALGAAAVADAREKLSRAEDRLVAAMVRVDRERRRAINAREVLVAWTEATEEAARRLAACGDERRSA